MAEILDAYGNKIKTDKTVGGHAKELLEKPEKMEVGETSKGASQDYMKELVKCCEDGLKQDYEGDFYVVVMKKRERHMLNVFRCFYYHRQTKPSPMWDMDCWRVNQNGDLFYCWTLPDIQTGHDMLENPQDYVNDSPEIVKWVHQFSNDRL